MPKNIVEQPVSSTDFIVETPEASNEAVVEMPTIESLVDKEIERSFDADKIANLTPEDVTKYNESIAKFRALKIDLETMKKEISEKKYILTTDENQARYIHKFVDKDHFEVTGRENKGYIILFSAILESYQQMLNTPKGPDKIFALRGMDLRALDFFANKYKSTNSSKSESFVMNLYSPLEDAIRLLDADIASVQAKEQPINELQGDITILLEGLVEEQENGEVALEEVSKPKKNKK